MSKNTVERTRQFGNVVYDSDSDTPKAQKRIGTSATEIEFLNDLPPSKENKANITGNTTSDRARVFNTQIKSPTIDKQRQTNNYQTLSINREQSRPNIIYRDNNNNQPLNSTVNKLLEKYAPDAIPQNLINTTPTNTRLGPQVNVAAGYAEPLPSTFQTPSTSFSSALHNYSTIVRPKNDPVPQINNTTQRPTSYDTFQHVIPPTYQQNQMQSQAKPSVSGKTTNGNFANVVPGKLYTLADDPLHLLYDRQNVNPSKTQPSSKNTTFYTSANQIPTNQDPFTILFTNSTENYPQQTIPPPRPTTTTTTTTTANINSNPMQTIDLADLIRRVQQDYLREIQPFVSSVKFIEKDREYGQNLSDVGFTTPVTVRKGYTKQADDILRRSFGRHDHREKGNLNHKHNHHTPHGHHNLEKMDSKQSFTSVTTISTDESDSDEQSSSLNSETSKPSVRNQATSPPPKITQTKPQSPPQNKPIVPKDIPKTQISTDKTDEDDESTASPPLVVKPATRIPADQSSITSSDSTTSDVDEDFSAVYNEHETPKTAVTTPFDSIKALVANTPIVDRTNSTNPAPQRSEDIHPTPPTIRPKSPSVHSTSSTIRPTPPTVRPTPPTVRPTPPAVRPTPPINSRVPVRKVETDESDTVTSESDEDKETGEKKKTPTGRISPLRGPNISTGRPGGTPQAASRSGLPNPVSTPRVPGDNNTRLPFVPPTNQQSTTTNRPGFGVTNTQQSPTIGPIPTGSTKLFTTDPDMKSGSKRSTDASHSMRSKIKSFFRR